MTRLEAAARTLAQADRALTHRLARGRDRPLGKLFGWLGEAGDQPQLLSLAGATLAVGAFAGRRDLLRGGARMLAAELVATGAKAVVKRLVDRSRPEHALATGDRRFGRGDHDAHELTSFPSGHTAGAVAVALAAAREIDGVGGPAALGAVLVAAVQAPSGHHYLGDVAAGAALGWLAEAAVNLAAERLAPKDAS